jgi:hypothetical protein
MRTKRDAERSEMTDLERWMTFRPWQRHGLVLMVGGLVYIFVGIAFLSVGELTEKQELSLIVALRVLPIDGWGTLFIVAGLLSCLSSRWPSFSETWGYTVLTGISAGWSSMYAAGYILGYAEIQNVTAALVWGLMAFMWWAISGLLNPPKEVVVMLNEST